MANKWLLALGIACPACAGGFLFAMAAILGISAALIKGSLLLLGFVAVAYLFWGREAIRKRREAACCEPDSSDGPAARSD